MQFETRSLDRIRILKICGSFQGRDAARMRKWLDVTIHQDSPNIVINMEEVSSVNSEALSALLYGLKESRKLSGNLLLCEMQQEVRILFEMTRMSQVFTILPKEKDALREFGIKW